MKIDPQDDKTLEALAREDVAKDPFDLEEAQSQLLDVQLWGVFADKKRKLEAQSQSLGVRRKRLLAQIETLQRKENRLKWRKFSVDQALERLDNRAEAWEKKHRALNY